ncbi:MAG: outer membrane lipoprotein-sorting protein [Deltaproteobacteria bacterium]|nr:outer membrane lipoprotein-sorting protein [Deltaproteobacteria bacterium]
MTMKTTLLLGLLCATAGLPVADASANVAAAVPVAAMGVDASQILAEVDKRAAAFSDQSYKASMEIIKSGQLKKRLEFTAVMKGLDKQLIRFSAPGDVEGMKVLMEDASNLYLYLPEFKKVRRVAAHVQSQGFLGSTFTYEHMTQVRLSPHFKAEMGGKEGSITTLILTPKDGVESSYSKIEITIDGSKGGVTRLRYYDSTGADVLEQNREDWVKIGEQLVPTRISMLNIKTGDLSVIKMTDIVVNQGVDDSIFSRRELLRE